MKTNKYKYLKVIQQYYNQGWEDVSEYETNSQGTPKEFEQDGKSLLNHDLKEYMRTGYATRVVKRKELTALTQYA